MDGVYSARVGRDASETQRSIAERAFAGVAASRRAWQQPGRPSGRFLAVCRFIWQQSNTKSHVVEAIRASTRLRSNVICFLLATPTSYQA